MEEFDLLIARFLNNVKHYGEKKIFTFVDDKGKVTESYTYEKFEKVTRSIACALLERGCKAGENVVLVYPPCLDFIVTFFACLRAGIVAVPVYPPHPGRRKDIAQFIAVQSSSGATVALTNTTYDYAKKMIKAKKFFTDRGTNKTWPDLKWIVTNKIKSSKVDMTIDVAKPSDLAFLQYTSGSTSQPKGVMLTHSNVSHNLSCIIRALEADEKVQVVSWLPQYHDMGLIGSYLGVLYCGGSGVYMSPFSFVKDPVLWLRQISLHKATHIQSPNFGYKLASRKFDKYKEKVGHETAMKEVDLSSLKHMFNAAEPIDVNAMNEFKEKFASYGLNGEAFSPGFGLAENSVYVSDRGSISLLVDKLALETKLLAEEVEEGASHATLLQGCGDPHRHPEAGIFVRIVDKECYMLPDECQVGEIWIASPSKGVGYYGLEELTNTNLKAKLKIKEKSEVSAEDADLITKDWHRTGDLGFFYKRELFVCGRIKDLIIIRGRNYFPQDIEFTVENNHDYAQYVRPGCTATFSITSEQAVEELIIVAEVRNTALSKKSQVDLDAMAKAIAQGVLRDNEVNVSAISLIKQGSIVKTTSGKIKRFGNRVAFLKNDLKEVYRYEKNKTSAQAMSPIKSSASKANTKVDENQQGMSNAEILKEITEEAARLVEKDIGEVDSTTTLRDLGMDSVFLTQFKALLLEKYSVEVDEEHLHSESLTLEKLAKYVHNKMNGVDDAKFSEVDVKSSIKNKTKGRKKFFCC